MRFVALCSLCTACSIAACGSGNVDPIPPPSDGGPDAPPIGAVDAGAKDAGMDATGTGGEAGADAGAACKRGVAANTAPGAAFFPALAWWYNWGIQSSGTSVGIEFDPMVWGSSTLGVATPIGSRFLLGFNEPNFKAQANLTPQQAASDWPMVEAQASATGAAIVSPAMNFCGPAAQCNGTDPYQYLKDFFAACSSCKVDYVAVHWYNCDLPSLKAYLEGGGSLQGFVQFGRPIWLTEFCCGNGASEAEQATYMRAAVPYLESNPHVFRYSWFSADPIPNARLINSDGSPTALGQVYTSLARGCP